MFKMILAAVVAVGFSSFAFAEHGGEHKKTVKTEEKMKKDGKKEKKMKETTTTEEAKPADPHGN